jgi:predicted RND superfamily exporter protein
LQVSEVPLIRTFGVMLAIGIVAMFIAGLPGTTSVLEARERRHPTTPGAATLPHGPLERFVRWLCFSGRRITLPLVLAGVAVIVAGLAVEGRFTIQTDPEQWAPQGGETVRDLRALRDGAGFSTELSLLIEADDVTATPVASWMQEYSAAQLEAHRSQIVHGFSLASVAADVTGVPPGQDEMALLLGGALDDPPTYEIAPEDFVASFISPDKTKAALIFPITNIPLSEREALLDAMLADLDPPPGVRVDAAVLPPDDVTVTPAGLVVVGVELVNLLEANRSVITWTAIAAVAIWLLIWYRRLSMALLPLFPVLIAVGGSSLVIFATGLELSPLTTVTGPLVIAVCTEFTVLLLARYLEERGRGRTPEEAVEIGAVRIGRAFVASGLTAVGGFAVLALSSFPLLRDFGIVVALSVLVALLAALVVLPPLLMWADRSRWVPDFHPGDD